MIEFILQYENFYLGDKITSEAHINIAGSQGGGRGEGRRIGQLAIGAFKLVQCCRSIYSIFIVLIHTQVYQCATTLRFEKEGDVYVEGGSESKIESLNWQTEAIYVRLARQQIVLWFDGEGAKELEGGRYIICIETILI